ncbi:acrB/AcrD/AcrF family protein [Sphingomonas sp. S17]|uniref:Efflux RND transporter permease subunit n=2 Tax=Sphingomonas paucimobilis TaxID=13689 RepID=A0A411LIY2_SPHPI|nr:MULTISPECIES: efflux RND transporter permease subunit [Sphingomonas]EGI54607.1 acrB/AcrD/AcrF family protein [Sphingomonas sp. S17]MBQ1478886.1 efflux RND transporter permease subunit [Sphingomonas sp.]MCM3678378.1 efflux RND transporter permease subunit [Sphingomonas paucimobilis]MDG5969406.1 efflux RND transporter permease subunit [Sphingomonas paucimobilis]NNG57016.1 efflux RND transporter permease subunit [Sphingomonas paucimobilis]
MSFRNISAWAIRNPVPPIVLFVALTLAGIVSFMRMDVNNDPDIDFPIVVVVVNQPGAAPTELETQVTQRVEAALRNLQGVDQITSTVTEGTSQTLVQLDIGTPIDRAVSDARDAITQIRSMLPDGILEPQVIRVDSTDNDLASYSAVASNMTPEQLSWYIDNNVTKELLSVPGLSKVIRNGGVTREIRVILDPLKLQAQGLTASEVNAQLRMTNLNAAGGRAEIAGTEQAVRVLGNARNAYDLGQTQINVRGGRTVRLADIATVRDLYAEQRSQAAVDGRQVISFDFQRAKGASDVSVFNGAVEKLKALEKRNPEVKFVLRSNSVKYTEQQYESAIHAMIEGAVLAVIVVFIFLRDWRATVISALAIPLSAIPAFWFMDLLGFTLNQMTLLALSLVAGVLVDDAIVEIENIVRHMRMGKSAYQASIDAADEIGLAVLATTMAIVAVFLPVALMPGVPGQYFKNFGLTVVVSVLMSLAVARMITPMIAAYFLKSAGHASHGEGRLMDAYMATLRWSLRYDRPADGVRRGFFRRFFGRFRDHRLWVIGIGFGAFALTVAMFIIIPKTFQPPQDNDQAVAKIEMVPGTTLGQTDVVVRQVAQFLRKQPDVESVYSRTGVGNGRVVATLKEDRSMKSTDFERSLAPQLAAIPDARVTFQSQFGWGSSGRDLTITLGGDDPAVLRQTANKIVEQMGTLPGLVAPRIVGNLDRPEIVIRPRLDLAANLGVTTQALSSAIRIATLGDIDQNSARFSLSDRQVPIRVALDQNARARMATIQNLPVQTQTGGSVPLSVVADIGLGAGPTQIDRVNQRRQVTVGADLAKGVISGDAMKKVHDLPIMKNLPMGVSEMVLGQAKMQAEMMQNFFTAIISAIFMVFAVLVLLYRRFLPPFVNMASLLLAPLGGLIALYVTGNPLSLPVYIGLLMLLGIVAKNSILLIDFALEEIAKGVPVYEAVLDAGHKRAQPIVMTTVAMVAGMVPTALSLGGDGSWRSPMGVTVIGGLTMSTLLTLLIVPAAFSLAVGVERWIGPRLGKRLLTYKPGDELGGGPVIEGPTGGPALPPAPGKLGYDPAE